MKREEFIAAIGYQGDSAVIDKRLLSEVKSLNTRQLLDKGSFRAAFCSALFKEKSEGESSDAEMVLEEYNKNSGRTIGSVDDLKRLFGVFDVPEKITKRTLI